MKPDLTTFIAACPADIRSHFQEQTYSFHDKLMEQNKKSDCIYILLNGIVKNYHFEINGNVYIEDIDTGVTIYGELEALIDKETVSTVEAVTECRVLKLENAQFLKWLRADNAFTLYITTLIAQRNYDCSKRERVNAFYPLKYRIMYMIYNTLCKKDLTITKDLLVEGTGSNIRSINRVVQTLIRDGILDYKSGIITVHSMERLEEEIKLYS